MTTAHKNEL